MSAQCSKASRAPGPFAEPDLIEKKEGVESALSASRSIEVPVGLVTDFACAGKEQKRSVRVTNRPASDFSHGNIVIAPFAAPNLNPNVDSDCTDIAVSEMIGLVSA